MWTSFKKNPLLFSLLGIYKNLEVRENVKLLKSDLYKIPLRDMMTSMSRKEAVRQL